MLGRPPPVDFRRPETLWYGADPAFWYPLQRDARRVLTEKVLSEYRPEVLSYTVDRLAVPGETRGHTVTIEFWRAPEYETYGLHPRDYPRINTDSAEPRKHSFCSAPRCACIATPRLWGTVPHSGPLCLWFPLYPPELRWTSEMGLLVLIEMVRRHLLAELEWRRTGRWILEEAAHGFPEQVSA
jgi:hypothetical protein